MFNISLNNQITISRGDTAVCSIQIATSDNTKCSSELYKLTDGDCVFFSVMESDCKYRDVFEEFNSGLIRKKFTKDDLDENNEVIVEFVSSDTQTLLPGTYYYSVKLQKEDSSIHTIIDKTKFIVRG